MFRILYDSIVVFDISGYPILHLRIVLLYALKEDKLDVIVLSYIYRVCMISYS